MGRVHLNVDPVSWLRRRQHSQERPIDADSILLKLKPIEDPLKNMFEEVGPQFEKKLLTVASNFMSSEIKTEEEAMNIPIKLWVGNSKEVDAFQ